MRSFLTGTAFAALALVASGAAQADDEAKTALKPFSVTIRVFDPTRGIESGQDYVLPVDSPDAEHAIASTTANAASHEKDRRRQAAAGQLHPRQGRTALSGKVMSTESN